MQIFYSPSSPFVRKCLVTAKELDCFDEIQLLDSSAHPIDRDKNILKRNPLGQVPTLVTYKDESLFDSRVICEYLNKHKKGNLFGDDESKWDILKEHAIADGIMTTTTLIRIETQMRPTELEWKDLTHGHFDKICTSLSYFEESDEALTRPINIAQITLACALAYLDFRLPYFEWRKDFPKLAEWFNVFRQRPSMQSTEFHLKS
ncbi:glutathione S-transferase family protein [Pelistega europaea]|uniref:Glutathione S-transferase family protein n=1 Tax=Pelistega europaea TaxID=106147 RepID=A0A7Y4LAS4_9BURK|nr:glutathione S-transferase family protein [Pelistega europaea]NOL50088.1 glutathione S-transferase family protein [Pelistega europaea]